ncbi:MAG: pilus assembly protein [Alphaproteobacteria bacterium]|nr:pilus assembly protein [Alphaproteobacteria bacterium]
MPLLCRLAACRRGSTAVELALILPAFLAVVFAAIELSRYVWTRTTVQHATDEAARYALAHPTATSAAIVQVAKDAAIGLDANDPCLLGFTAAADPADSTFTIISTSCTFQYILPEMITYTLIPYGADSITARARVPND